MVPVSVEVLVRWQSEAFREKNRDSLVLTSSEIQKLVTMGKTMPTLVQLSIPLLCAILCSRFATSVESAETSPIIISVDSDGIDSYALTDDGYDYSSPYRTGRQQLVNVTALLINKTNATLNYLADPNTLPERVIGKILIASAIALTLLSIALALFAGLAEFGYSRSYYDDDHYHGKDHYRRKRSLDEDNEGYSLGENIIRLMEVAKEMYDGFDVKSVDCHRRLMCQLSKTEAYRQVGADRAFKFASLVENWVNLPPPVKVLVDQLKFAVSFGKKDVENAENRRREARRLQQLQVPYYVSAGDASSVLEDKESSNGHQSLAEENFRDSCEIAFPDCDFSFEKFIVEHSRRK